MTTTSDAMQELAAYGAARAALDGWIAGAKAFALVRAALASGLLDAAREPRAVPEIASATGLDAARVADLCLALDAHGILDRRDDRYQVSADIARLTAPAAMQRLDVIVGSAMVEIGVIAGTDADAPSAGDYRAMAEGVTLRPASPAALAVLESIYDAMPEARAALAAGGAYLELGCGVGGGLLGAALIFPQATAVGIELRGDIAVETRRRAAALGVADRVDVRQLDARELADEAAFDVAYWSQAFFPSDTRAATLAVAARALKPGGWLFMPLSDEIPADLDGLRAAAGRAASLARLSSHRWGLPTLEAAELRAELDAAGFEATRIVETPYAPLLLARRPVR